MVAARAAIQTNSIIAHKNGKINHPAQISFSGAGIDSRTLFCYNEKQAKKEGGGHYDR
jgi:hypothetical protein